MSFESILEAHLLRYSGMQLVDIYKLVHQAGLGSEHAVSSLEQARRWLEQEVANLGIGPDEPVADPISPQGDILRIHLRPFVRQGGDLQELLKAFVRTANEFHGSIERLRKFWRSVESAAEEGILAVSLEEVRAFWAAMKTRNFPAVHHSPAFQEKYRPAYCVVAWEYFTRKNPETAGGSG